MPLEFKCKPLACFGSPFRSYHPGHLLQMIPLRPPKLQECHGRVSAGPPITSLPWIQLLLWTSLFFCPTMLQGKPPDLAAQINVLSSSAFILLPVASQPSLMGNYWRKAASNPCISNQSLAMNVFLDIARRSVMHVSSWINLQSSLH